MAIEKEIIDRVLATSHGEGAYLIVEKLTDAGFDTWWVGGCVRQMLRGELPKDIDIATAAKPEEIQKVCPDAVAAAGHLGSMRIKAKGTDFEVTTFREDDEASDGRHPEAVVFGDRQQDAKRRDFTVNALYFHPISGELFDPFGGEADLKEKLVRFIGDPAIRMKHDALRILRAVRLRAAIDGQYHPDTYRALQELATTVEILSGSRQLEELEKMLKLPKPSRALEDLWELGILKTMLPELHACKGIPQPADYHHEGDVWEHSLRAVDACRDEDNADVRLAILFHDSGKSETFSLKERIRFDHHAEVSAKLVEKALNRMQCTAKRVKKICWMIEHHMMMGSFAKMTEERKSHWYHHPWFEDLLRLFYLDIAGTDPADFQLYDEIIADRNKFLDAHPLPEKPLLDGAEVMEILHLQPGEKVGKVLKALHEAQVRKEVASKKEAETFIRKMTKE